MRSAANAVQLTKGTMTLVSALLCPIAASGIPTSPGTDTCPPLAVTRTAEGERTTLGQAMYAETAAAQLAADPTLKWKLEQWIDNTPALGSDGTIYIVNENIYQDANKLVALSPAGSFKWQFTVNSGDPVPVVGPDGTVYVGGCAGDDLIAVNPDGTQKWTAPNLATDVPAVATDGTVYCGNNASLTAINPNGTTKWAYAIGPTSSAPVIGSGGVVYIVGGNGNALSAVSSSGTLEWQAAGTEIGRSTLAIGLGGVVVAAATSGNLFVFNGATGSLQWQSPTPGCPYSRLAGPVIGSDGTIFLTDSLGDIIARGTDGTQKWKQTPSSPDSSPLLGADGNLYLARLNGLTIRNPATGAVVGSYFDPLPSCGASVQTRGCELQQYRSLCCSSWMGSWGCSVALAADGTLYAGSSKNDRFYALQTGSLGLAQAPWPKYRADNQNSGRTPSPPPSADLAITKAGFPDPVNTESPLTYTIVASNAGPEGATSVTVTDTLPAGPSFVSASSTSGTCSGGTGGTVSCALGALAAGASVTITIVVTPHAGGSLTNSARVAAFVSDPNTANDVASETTAVVAAPLVASASASPASGSAPLHVTFGATASGGTPPYTYDWDFGDGTPHGTVQNPTHDYASAGSFPVTLHVLDAQSQSASDAHLTIAVTQPVLNNVYVIPSIAHAPGAGGTQWRTDVAAVNLAGSVASLELTYYSDAAPQGQSVTLAPFEARSWRDILVGRFGLSAGASSTGSIAIASDQPVYITSRTYNQTATGTYGQFYPACTVADAIVSGQIGVLPQLEKSSAFRTNIGILNLGSSWVSVLIKLHNATGAQVGSAKTLTADPSRWKQQYDIFANVGAGSQPVAYATVEVPTEGGRVWAYASVIDVATGDATTIPVLIKR